MPLKLIKCVKAVKAKGIGNPWAICIKSTGLYPHKRKGGRR